MEEGMSQGEWKYLERKKPLRERAGAGILKRKQRGIAPPLIGLPFAVGLADFDVYDVPIGRNRYRPPRLLRVLDFDTK